MYLDANYQDFVVIAICLHSRVIKTQTVVQAELSNNHGRQRLHTLLLKYWDICQTSTAKACCEHEVYGYGLWFMGCHDNHMSCCRESLKPY
mgnify:CR=1 FL=1